VKDNTALSNSVTDICPQKLYSPKVMMPKASRTAVSPLVRSASQRYSTGRAHQEIGQLDQAINCYRVAVQEDPSHLNANYNLARYKLFDKTSYP
jgi:tetratricopeptide (TPR) repeat protein